MIVFFDVVLQNLKTVQWRNIFISVCFFFIFDNFWGVWNWYLRLSLVLPVLLLLLLPNGFGCPISFLWSSRIIAMIAFSELISVFRKSIWSFWDFTSICYHHNMLMSCNILIFFAWCKFDLQQKLSFLHVNFLRLFQGPFYQECVLWRDF